MLEWMVVLLWFLGGMNTASAYFDSDHPFDMLSLILITALFQPIIFRLLRIIDCVLIYHRVTSLASRRAERLTRVST
jgi:hypothetical protein